jgi:hypothetical protein
VPVPINPGGKGPLYPDWQKLTGTDEELQRLADGWNLGVLLGQPSGGLVDVDLDCPEALKWAPNFLPPTAWKSGHATRPNSHYWYIATTKDGSPVPSGKKYQRKADPKCAHKLEPGMLVELRATGGQTMVTPSMHPEHGSYYQWSDPNALPSPPPKVLWDDLLRAVRSIAIACHLDHVFVPTQRHEVARITFSIMLRAGWTTEEILDFFDKFYGLDQVPEREVEQMRERLERSDTVEGVPSLAKLAGNVSAEAVGSICREMGHPELAKGVEARVDREEERAEQVERDFQHLQASAATWNFLTANPPKLDLYYGLFERGEVHVLSGCSTVGKSTRALWLAGHWVAGVLPFTLADGVRAMGAASDDLQAPARGKALVLYVSPDAQQGNLARTVKRLRERGGQYMGCDPKDFAAGHFYPLCRDHADVQRFTHYKLYPEGWKGLAELVGRLQASVCPDKAETVVPLVVLDTLARLSGKVNELDNHGLTELVERAEWLATQSGSVVLLLHHVAQVDHYKKFSDIDPLTYGRGGTGTAAAARVSIAMAKVEDCGGQVLGEKVAANNQPPVPARYFEVHADGGRGIDYFRPIPAADVEALQKKNNKDGQPSYGKIYHALQQAYPAGTCTKTELREVVAKLCNASAKTDSTIELADAFVKHCLAAGSIRVEDLGANRERHTFTPLAVPVSHPGD